VKSLLRKVILVLRAIIVFCDWHVWLGDRFGFLMKHGQFRFRDGTKFFFSPIQGDQIGYFQEIYLQKIYTKNYKPRERNGGVVLDLGANIGVFSIFIASLDPRFKVYSYEPAPRVFRRLVKNISANNLSERIHHFRYAVASKNAHEISLTEGGNDMLDDIEFKAPAITIEKIFEDNHINRCAFLKMDIEGMEFEVLPATPQEIWKRIDYVAMEYHDDPSSLKAILSKQGFTVESFHTTNTCGIIYADRK